MSNCDAGNGSRNGHIPLEIVIVERLKHSAPPSDSCCIYRVPEKFRCQNPSVYAPKVISIGPLHHGEEKLEKMEEHKLMYLKDYLNRTQVALESCIEIIRSNEGKLRSYYDEIIKYNSDDFIQMILMDSAFIIELLYKLHFEYHNMGQGIKRMCGDIRSDFLLLENQLPFFILQALFDQGRVYYDEVEGDKLSLIQLYLSCCGGILDEIGVVCSNLETVKGEHFLDMIRNLSLPPETNSVGEYNNPTEDISAPSVTELHQAGVKFKLASDRNLFSIKFENGILEIPGLKITDDWEPTLRNLAAFEQCRCDYNDKRIGDYIALLDCFINTPKDVELLIKYGIVTNYLGDSDKVCSMINGLGKGIGLSFRDFYFGKVCDDLNNHCKKPSNKWKANLRQSYLNTPWAILSIVAAAFLIILTVIQTVCSLISIRS